MHILVTSPIPSHPQNHGNRARVMALCKALQLAGAQIHFVYGGLERLTAEQEQEMRAEWDFVYVLPPMRAKDRRQSFASHHAIDDWYADALDDVVKKILGTWRVHYCIANYVWFSRWLPQVPAGIPTLIDTHDIFADRHARLKADGLAPSWFSTTQEEESVALNRANTVIAIQEAEALEFQTRTKANVVTLGHFIEPTFLSPRALGENQKVTIGYLASDNPINQQSLEALVSGLSKRPHLVEKFEFVLAGAICNGPAAQSELFKKLGFVKDATDFYRDVDVIINPNVGGTGLKIKSIEAMAFGKPLVATRDSMIGIQTDAAYHAFRRPDDMLAFFDERFSAEQLGEMAHTSQHIITDYMATQQKMLAALFPALSHSADPEPGDG